VRLSVGLTRRWWARPAGAWQLPRGGRPWPGRMSRQRRTSRRRRPRLRL